MYKSTQQRQMLRCKLKTLLKLSKIVSVDVLTLKKGNRRTYRRPRKKLKMKKCKMSRTVTESLNELWSYCITIVIAIIIQNLFFQKLNQGVLGLWGLFWGLRSGSKTFLGPTYID